jgi:murein DD-endopeptidase MepM/ murein hydrolase activator NlpD
VREGREGRQMVRWIAAAVMVASSVGFGSAPARADSLDILVATWKLPWAASENPWFLTNGPHGTWKNPGNRIAVPTGSGLDFDKNRTPRQILSMFEGEVYSTADISCEESGRKKIDTAIWVRAAADPNVAVIYIHPSSIAVAKGTLVRQGDVLGMTGAVGCATAVHLHIELLVGGAHTSWLGRVIDGWTVPNVGVTNPTDWPVPSHNVLGAGWSGAASCGAPADSTGSSVPPPVIAAKKFDVRALVPLSKAAYPWLPAAAIPFGFEVRGFNLTTLDQTWKQERLILWPSGEFQCGWASSPDYNFILLVRPSTPPGIYELGLELPDGRRAFAHFRYPGG